MSARTDLAASMKTTGSAAAERRVLAVGPGGFLLPCRTEEPAPRRPPWVREYGGSTSNDVGGR